jgi:hypothetical protein
MGQQSAPSQPAMPQQQHPGMQAPPSGQMGSSAYSPYPGTGQQAQYPQGQQQAPVAAGGYQQGFVGQPQPYPVGMNQPQFKMQGPAPGGPGNPYGMGPRPGFPRYPQAPAYRWDQTPNYSL